MASGKVRMHSISKSASTVTELATETMKESAPVLITPYPNGCDLNMDMYGGSAVVEDLAMYHSTTIIDNLMWGIGRMMSVRLDPSNNYAISQRNTWYSNKNLFKIVSGSYSYTLASKSYMNITAGNLGLSAQTGYTPIGIMAFDVDVSMKGVVLVGLNLTSLESTANVLVIRNTRSAQAKSKAVIDVIFMRNANP